MASAPGLTYTALHQSISAGRISPVYLLHGEEGFFIDRLVHDFESLVPDQDRDFNLYNIYAPETSPEAVMSVCRSIPMIGDRQVVILREAQAIRADQLNKMHSYCMHPTLSTVLVICCRGAAAKGKDLLAAVKSTGVIFESKKVSDRNLATILNALVKERGLNIEAKGLAMLSDHIGNDLSRIYGEIEKLSVVLPVGSMVTPEVIERNVGISKDYNNFELVDAVALRDLAKIFKIIGYFRANPKSNPTLMTVSALFNYFSNLLIVHFTKDKSPGSLMGALGLKWQSQLRNYEYGARNYNAWKTIEIIGALRDFDRKSKGIGSRRPEYDLLEELMFRIVYAKGVIDV